MKTENEEAEHSLCMDCVTQLSLVKAERDKALQELARLRERDAQIAGLGSQAFQQFLGADLVKARDRLKEAIHAAKEQKDTGVIVDAVIDLCVAGFMRFVRVGLVGLLLAAAPTLILIIQTALLSNQNALQREQLSELQSQFKIQDTNRALEVRKDLLDILYQDKPLRLKEEALLDYLKLEREDPRGILGIIDLRGVDLARARLTKRELSNVDYSHGHFAEATLNDANLSKALFSLANLRRANLIKANLEETAFNGADLRGANLKEATGKPLFIHANLCGARIPPALRTGMVNDTICPDGTLSGANGGQSQQTCEGHWGFPIGARCKSGYVINRPGKDCLDDELADLESVCPEK
jgi:uncharacterized protein YjbI with pentapeptide repeats